MRLHDVLAHRRDVALELGHQTREEVDVRGAVVAHHAHHRADRVAAVRRIEQRELLGVLSGSSRGDSLEQRAALERLDAMPSLNAAMRGASGSIDVTLRIGRNADLPRLSAPVPGFHVSA